MEFTLVNSMSISDKFMENVKYDIAILILNYKKYEDTIKIVEEIRSQRTELNIFILIVDNKSPNESFDVLKATFNSETDIEVIDAGVNGGYAKGNNCGVEYLKKISPDYLLVANNDIHFDVNVFNKLISVYNSVSVVGALAPMQLKPNGEQFKLKRIQKPTFIYDILVLLHLHFWNAKYECNCQYEDLQRVDIIPGSFIFIKYQTMIDIGGFYDGTFLFFEERFLARKIEEAGLNSYLLLTESYIHEHSATINSEVAAKQQRKFMFDGRLLYAQKYYKPLWLVNSLFNVSFKIGEMMTQLMRVVKR